MTSLAQEFDAAASRMARAPILKLFDPGIHRFIVRWIERKRGKPSPHAVRLFFGADMTVVLPEVISEALYTYGLFDETVTWMALKSVRPGDVIFDVGAHFGYFSLLFAHLAGTKGRVIAFEPTPSTFAILEENARRSDRIEPVNQAASNASGEVEIADFGLKYSAWNTLAAESRMSGMLAAGGAKHLTVRTVRLDEFARERKVTPDFVKIDAENFEHAVVSGMQGILENSQPVILLESGSESALAAGHALAARGYLVIASNGPGSLFKWDHALAEANARYKDLLFVPPQRWEQFNVPGGSVSCN